VPLEQVQVRIRDINAALYHESDSFLTWTEARMLSARDAKFRARFAALIVERRDFVVTLIEYLCKDMGATPSVPLEALAMAFISLSEGVRLFEVSCPSEMPADVAQSTLNLFVDAVLQQVMLRGGSKSAGASR